MAALAGDLMPGFVSLVFLGVLSRLLPHPANFTPVGALALFGGYHFGDRRSLFLPILILFFSDLMIGVYYGPTMASVYLSFLLTSFLGRRLRKGGGIPRFYFFSLGASTLFYLVTNFAVWAEPHSWYPKTAVGLASSYFAGLPFYRNTLLGDFFYTSVIFGISYLLGWGRRTVGRERAGFSEVFNFLKKIF